MVTTEASKLLARILRDAGMEVIYAGFRPHTPSGLAASALQEDVAPAVVEALRQVGAGAAVVVGGVIPDVDRPRRQDAGVRAVLTRGSSNTEVIAAIRSAAADRLMSL